MKRTESLEKWYSESDTAKLTSADLDALDEFVVKQTFTAGFEAAKKKAIALIEKNMSSLAVVEILEEISNIKED